MMKRMMLTAALWGLTWLAQAGEMADEMNGALEGLIHDWDVANFENRGDAKAQALAALAERAQALSEAHPGQAEPLIWEAIVLSSYAGAKGGLGALDLVKQARDLLLEAEKIDPDALNGSVYTSLGSLYYQVPGWPVGFGDDDKARQYLEKALAKNPDGLDPNYFYGDFLIEEGRYQQAVAALEKALQAPPRPGREVADRGRRAEVESALTKAKEKMDSPSFW